MEMSIWKQCSLSDVCVQIVDGTHKTPKYTKDGIRFVSIANIRPFQPISYVNYERYISLEEHKELCKRVSPMRDDILFSRIGTLGYAKKIDFDYPVSIFVGLGLARPDKEKILPSFLEYFMNTREVYRYSIANAKGTGRLTLPLEASRKMPFRYPPLQEQERIVARIEELFSQLDAGVETLKKTKAQLAVYRQAVLKEAFESIEASLYYPLTRVILGSPQNGLYKPKSDYCENGTPILRIDGFYDGFIINDYHYKRLKLTDEEKDRYGLNVGDLVVNRVNSMPYLGKCALVRILSEATVFESNMMRIKLNTDIVIGDWVTYYLSSHVGKKELTKNAKQAVNQASINQTDVGNTLIPIPPIEDQKRLVRTIESRLSVCDSIEQTVDTSLQQAEAMRQSILKQAFEGRL